MYRVARDRKPDVIGSLISVALGGFCAYQYYRETIAPKVGISRVHVDFEPRAKAWIKEVPIWIVAPEGEVEDRLPRDFEAPIGSVISFKVWASTWYVYDGAVRLSFDRVKVNKGELYWWTNLVGDKIQFNLQPLTGYVDCYISYAY